ncbi:MAG TPA: outer membrane beta-barrel protein [Xanthobacteraceae bacterium]|nr:outer membrane beta-barrel protein [Xanthobacteraceae bacterium]
MPRRSAFRFAVPIGAALAGLCGASLWAQTAPTPPNGLRPTFDDTGQDLAPWKKKARRPAAPVGVIPKFGNPPGSGAGTTGFNSLNVRPRGKRPDNGTPAPTDQSPRAKAAAKPPGLPPPPPPRAARPGKPLAAVVVPPLPPAGPGGSTAPTGGGATPTSPDVTGVVPPSDAVVLPVPAEVKPRPRPIPPDEDPFGPTGFYAGGFLWRPALELMTGYDTNPARLPLATFSPQLIVAPELVGHSDWERHQLDIAIRGSYNYYSDTPLGDRPSLDARADGRIDVTKDTRIDIEGRFLVGTDYPGSPNIQADYAALPIYTDAGVTLGIGQRFNRLDISLKGTIDRIEWQDSLLTNGTRESNDDRNYDQYGAQLRGSYEVLPGLKPFAEVDADTRIHDLPIDRTGADRDSDGVAMKVGSSFEFTRTLTGEIGVGYLERFYGDPVLPDIRAPLIDASLIWAATALTTIKYVGTTTVDESVLPEVSGVVRHNNGIEISHALRRWLITTVKFGYGIDDYIGEFRQDHRYLASLGIIYKLNRDLWLKGELRQEWLISNIPNSNYAATIATIGLRLQR